MKKLIFCVIILLVLNFAPDTKANNSSPPNLKIASYLKTNSQAIMPFRNDAITLTCFGLKPCQHFYFSTHNWGFGLNRRIDELMYENRNLFGLSKLTNLNLLVSVSAGNKSEAEYGGTNMFRILKTSITNFSSFSLSQPARINLTEGTNMFRIIKGPMNFSSTIVI